MRQLFFHISTACCPLGSMPLSSLHPTPPPLSLLPPPPRGLSAPRPPPSLMCLPAAATCMEKSSSLGSADDNNNNTHAKCWERNIAEKKNFGTIGYGEGKGCLSKVFFWGGRRLLVQQNESRLNLPQKLLLRSSVIISAARDDSDR